MKEFTVQVPQGWFTRLFIYLLVISSALLLLPFYLVYVKKIEVHMFIEEAKAKAEAMAILGKCQDETAK